MKTITLLFLSAMATITAAAQPDSSRCISPLDITYTEWGNMPTADRIYYQALILQNARYDFYTNLEHWVAVNGTKELRGKVKMTEKNFLKKIKDHALTPAQIQSIMRGFVPPYPPNMYGHDLSNEPERELGAKEN